MSSTVVIPPADLFPTTGTGNAVLASSPTLVTPNLGNASATLLTMSGSVHGANGTFGNPSFAFNSDQTTGLYRIAAGNIGVAAGGVKALDISSTGVVATTTLADQGGTISAQRNGLAPAQGLVFDGTNGATISNVNSLGTAFTIAYTNRPTTIAALAGLFTAAGGFAGNIYAATGAPQIYNGTAYKSAGVAGTAGITDFWTYTLSGGTGVWYKNGVAVATAADAGTYPDPITRLGNDVGNYLFTGTFSRPLIYNRALSAAEVLALYQSSAPAGADYGAGLVASTVNATAMVVGRRYRILVVGTTTFTSHGASANTVGTEFVATSVGTGTGTTTAIGLLLAPDSAQAGGGLAWYDTSGNAANITLPATGVSWSLPTSGKAFSLSLASSTAGSAGAGALVVTGGLSAGADSYIGGKLTQSVAAGTVIQSLVHTSPTAGVYQEWKTNTTTDRAYVGTGNQVISGGSIADFAINSVTGNVVLGTASAARLTIGSAGATFAGAVTVSVANPEVSIRSASDAAAQRQYLTFGSPNYNRAQFQSVSAGTNDGSLELRVFNAGTQTLTQTWNKDGSSTFAGAVTLQVGSLLNFVGGGSTAYSIQGATSASPYDFRFTGAADAVTQRNFSFGYYTGDNASNAWNQKAAINSYTGAATFAGAVSVGNTVGVGVAVASTHKVTMVIGGITYYLLASNV